MKPSNGFLASPEFIDLYEAGDYRGLCDASEDKGGTRVEGVTGAEGRRGWFVGPVFNADNTAIAEDENGDRVILTPELYGYDDNYAFAFSHKTKLKKSQQAQIDMLNAKFGTDYKEGDKIQDSFGTVEEAEAAVANYNKVLNAEYEEQRLRTAEATVDNTCWNSGARCWKYEADKSGTYTYSENDFVFFRYADVLYMKAEAILRGGNGNLGELLADADFQKIRTRVGLTAYAS